MTRRFSVLVGALILLAACDPTTGSSDESVPATVTNSTVASPSTTTTAVEEGPVEIGGMVFDEVEVLDVPDGDSLVVRFEDGSEERVRLLGINAPERDECLGDEARASLDDLVGDVIALGTEEDDRDQFDRILGHVFVGRGYVNRAQVERGLAIAMSDDNEFVGDLELAQELARDEAVGLWSPDSCGGAPIASGIVVGEVVANPPGPDDEVLDEELVEIVNTGDETVDLTGWVLRDESTANRFPFPTGFTLGPGESVQIVSGCNPSAQQLGWCADQSVWNNAGDSVIVLDRDGRIVDLVRV